MKPWQRTRPIDWLLFGLVVMGFLAAAWLLCWPSAETFFNKIPEGWKIATQFVVTAIGGGIVALVFRQWERESNLREARRDAALEFSRQFSTAYNGAKKVRRILKASFSAEVNGSRSILKREFVAQIDALNEHQLKLEGLKCEAEFYAKIWASDNFVGARWSEIGDMIDKMEHYLNNICSEWENRSQNQKKLDDLIVRFENKSVVCKFVAKNNTSQNDELEQNFFEHKDKIRDKLRELITEKELR